MLTGKKKKPDHGAEEFQKIGIWAEIWRDYKKNKGAMAGLITIIAIILVAVLAEFLFDYSTQVVGIDIVNALQPPSAKHLFGTDQYGRDIAVRILYGARYSLAVGICAVMVSVLIGSGLGILAGYYGGVTETLIMRTMDVISPIPSLLLAICISTAFGQST